MKLEMLCKNCQQQYCDRSWRQALIEPKLQRTAQRAAGALLGLFFATTTPIGMRHPFSPMSLPVLFDLIYDFSKLSKLKFTYNRMELLRNRMPDKERGVLNIQKRKNKEIEDYTRTAITIKTAFLASNLLLVLGPFLVPSMSDPLAREKEQITRCLDVIGAVGMLSSGAYGLYHWLRDAQTPRA